MAITTSPTVDPIVVPAPANVLFTASVWLTVRLRCLKPESNTIWNLSAAKAVLSASWLLKLIVL